MELGFGRGSQLQESQEGKNNDQHILETGVFPNFFFFNM